MQIKARDSIGVVAGITSSEMSIVASVIASGTYSHDPLWVVVGGIAAGTIVGIARLIRRRRSRGSY